MSENNNIKQSQSEFSGFSTDNALKFWLFFLFSFFFILQYPIPLSILLGAVGGTAGGWVIGWWNTKDDPIERPQPEENKPEEEVEEAPVTMTGLRRAKQERDALAARRSESLPAPLNWLFKKRDKSFKSRRRNR